MRRALTLLVALLVLAGCGGSSPDADEGPDTTEPQVSQEERERVSSAAKRYLENDDPAKCTDLALESALQDCRRDARKPVSSPELEEPEVVEATAHVAFTGGSGKGEVTLRSNGSDWKVEKVD